MKQENLNELRNIYLGLVTGGEGPEVLNESFGPFLSQAERDDINRKMRQGRALQPVKAAVPVKPVPVKPKVSQYTPKNLGDKQFADFKAGGGDAAVLKGASVGEIVAKGRIAQRPPAGPGGGDSGSSDNDSSGNGSGGPTRPAASGPVLSKLDGVEGTGVGANFKAKAFNDTERTRYSSVAAQNAARTSAASAVSPTNTPPATTSTADKIKGGLSNYQSQVKSGDVKGAEETGKINF